MARAIDADAVLDRYYAEYERQDICDGAEDREWLMKCLNEAPTLTPPNAPQTIEQLREMDGEPVYAPETDCWVLITKNQFVLLFTWPDGGQCSAHDWCEQVGPVYRRPPERQEGALAIKALRADLARVTAERDGAEKEITRLKAIMREKGIFTIPAKYPWEAPEWNW